MMLNVVVAILLDEFIATVTREKEDEERRWKEEQERRKITGCLDPITNGLVIFDNQEDLEGRINQIFSKLDEDDSGGISYEELKMGLKESFRNVHFTRDDFEILSENGRHLGPTGEFNSEQFQV